MPAFDEVEVGTELPAQDFQIQRANLVRYAGASGEAQCQWQEVSDGVYAISWQEADGATVVHIDDFIRGRSQAFFTAADLSFYRMQGPLTELH